MDSKRRDEVLETVLKYNGLALGFCNGLSPEAISLKELNEAVAEAAQKTKAWDKLRSDMQATYDKCQDVGRATLSAWKDKMDSLIPPTQQTPLEKLKADIPYLLFQNIGGQDWINKESILAAIDRRLNEEK